MKQINEQINKQVDVNAHTEASEKFVGERGLSTLLKKFKDVESLCKAYNSLQSEFTKRCQKVKELEGENEKLQAKLNAMQNKFINQDEIKNQNDFENQDEFKKQDETVMNIDNPTEEKGKEKSFFNKVESVDNGLIGGLVEEKSESESLNDVDVKANCLTNAQSDVLAGERLGKVLEFFKDFPDAVKYATEIGYVACGKDFTKDDLQKAYINILQSRSGGFLDGCENKEIADKDLPVSVKERIIKEYLTNLRSQPTKTILLGGKGEIPLTPPFKPQSIAEAGALAKNLIKLR